ncbi:sugar translocase [Bacillus cereus]|uniref:lipopolysaccharide biosynthesis protein n=1 Tax=Bacillus cereus TaxID=1396 RepID=UPI000BF1B0E3|nr:hypothetical protein [Bacillus cereus]MDA1770119.1 sugar translocase [Bacillus cereus]PEM00700.1 hypothetical protein CN602_17165 [Bacillus cereus]HDR6269334.1 sugar translocase [Bacillus cereus]
MSRTGNSLKNIKYAVIGQVLALIISFITRMIFVQTLSSEYLGINGLFSNILSMLSIAELGVGAAIVYSLYKPLSEQDVPKIKTLMSLYKKAYITIGMFIAMTGVIITPFLNFIIKDMPDIPHIEFIYVLFVLNSAMSYFFSYKRSLIIADQKRYIATFYRYGFFLILNVVQIIILLITKNYLYYLILQLCFTFMENIAISRKANTLYPYLREKDILPLDKETKGTISRNIKAMMGHNVGGIVVNGTDSLLISKFVGVVAVGLYSNYLLITSALNTVFGIMFQAVTASVGNLGVTESGERSHFIFRCLNLIGFWIHGFAAIALINLLNPFLKLWLGEEYLFSLGIVLVIVVNFYFTGMRKSVLTFRDALGLYWYDRYKPFFEAGINLLASIILGKYFGIIGIFIGTIISTLSTCFWVEPYMLFKYGFRKSVKPYFLKYITYTITVIVTGAVTWSACNLVDGDSISSFLLKLIICSVLTNLIFLCVFWRSDEFKYLLKVLKTQVKKKIKIN